MLVCVRVISWLITPLFEYTNILVMSYNEPPTNSGCCFWEKFWSFTQILFGTSQNPQIKINFDITSTDSLFQSKSWFVVSCLNMSLNFHLLSIWLLNWIEFQYFFYYGSDSDPIQILKGIQIRFDFQAIRTTLIIIGLSCHIKFDEYIYFKLRKMLF